MITVEIAVVFRNRPKTINQKGFNLLALVMLMLTICSDKKILNISTRESIRHNIFPIRLLWEKNRNNKNTVNALMNCADFAVDPITNLRKSSSF